MKTPLLSTLCGVLLLSLLTSCQKDELSAPYGSGERIEARANAQPVITYNPTPGVVGELVTVNLEFGTCGSGQLQEEIPVGSGTWVQRVGNTNAGAGNPDITYSFTPTQTGLCAYKFRAVVSGGQGCSAYTGAQPGVCLEVIDPCNIEAGDYFTYSQGFYLNSPNGEDFLDAHPELGPVDVGCAGGTTTTYSLDDIVAMVAGNSTPPGILAKQIITMTLNVSASAFLGSGEDLGCLVVVADDDPLTTLDDLFAGMTVNEILAAANDYVGGCDTTTFTEGELTAILEAIVDNFHLGEVNLGLLTCCEE